jgi:hypothetical protein
VPSSRSVGGNHCTVIDPDAVPTTSTLNERKDTK